VALSQRNKLGRPTSEVGQKRRFDLRPLLPVCPLSTDIVRPPQHVSNVPAAGNLSAHLEVRLISRSPQSKRDNDV